MCVGRHASAVAQATVDSRLRGKPCAGEDDGYARRQGEGTAGVLTSIHCYFCGAAQPDAGRSSCAVCGRTLQLPPSLVTLGRAYLLNRLGDLIAAGALDEASADRIRAIVADELGTAAGRPPVTTATSEVRPSAGAGPVAVAAPPPRPHVAPPATPAGPSFMETFFTPERAPSLLLYVGAFLVVVAALIFVNVSGQQISDSVRVALMIVGTLGFLGGGLVCHRNPRVEEAGRTFLIVGALLVPLDFGAYYALVAHVSPFTSPAMWVFGSLVAGGLYAALAITEYGRAYSYFFLVASLSALGGTAVLLAVPSTWFVVLIAAFPLAVQLAERFGGSRTLRLVEPLDLPARFLMPATLGFGVLPTVAFSLIGDLSFVERLAIPALAVLGTGYYAARTDRDHQLERWLVTAGPAAVAFGFLFSVSAPGQTYGFVSGLLAVGYALLREVGDLAGAPSPFPQWARDRARNVAYALIAIAFLPLAAYWRAPLVGATTYLGLSALLGALAVWRAFPARQSKAPPELNALVLVGAGALHVGAAFLLIASGLTHAGVAIFSGIEPRALALGFTPIAAGLGILAAIARRSMPILADVGSITGLGSAMLVVSTAFDDPGLATVLAAAATVGAVATAIDGRQPKHLWIASGFASAAAVSAGRWLQPSEELRPLALSGAAVLLFVAAYHPRFRANGFARVAREIAVATSFAGVAVGLGFALARPVTAATWDTPVWLATSPVFAVFGAIAFIEALHRRSERVALFATTSFLASVLIVVARLHPSAIEAFTLPAATYLGLAAWGIARYGSPALRADLLTAAQIGGAVALLLPTYIWSWEQDAVTRTLVVLAESVILLRFAGARGLRELGAVSIATLGLVVIRAVAAPLALEASTAAFGVITIALVLAIPRVSWRLPGELREAAEVVGVLLVLAPPLARATAFGDDALTHGATVLAGGVIIVALGLWSGRRALVASAAALLAATGVLALRDASRAEPFVAVAGAAILALVLAIPRFLPRRSPVQYEMALEILAVGLVVSCGMERTLTATLNTGGGHAARVLAESVTLLAIGLASSRRALASAGLGAVALGAVWILGDPAARQFHGIAAGAALVAIALAAIRFAPNVLDERALIGAELLGSALFVMPSLLASWNEAFLPGTPIVFFEITLLIGIGIVLRRRWLVAGALAALGLETLRASIDVVNRLPNWALFGGSGAILLTAGFVLLIKREAWNAWSRRAYQWWAGL